MDISETVNGEVRLYINTPTGFRIYDFQSGTAEDVSASNVSAEQLGSPVKGVLLGESFAVCYLSKHYEIS